MKDIKNTAVLAVVTYNNELPESTIPFTVATLINENGSFELPHCTVNGDKDIREQLLDSFTKIAEIEGVAINPDQFRSVGSYSIEHDDVLEVENAFVIFVDSKPAIRRIGGEKTPVWMNIDAFEHQPLYGNHNDIINDVKNELLESALAPSGNLPIGEETKTAIINQYFPKSAEERRPWVKRLQASGFNVHEYLHPGVAIDLVIFGYKKAEKGRKDELSVLLTYRKKDERLSEKETDRWAGTWSLPGTFLLEKKVKDAAGNDYPGLETVREAAVRIAKEKTGIDILPEDVLYDVKPFVHYSRMGWALRDGSPVITLPVFIPVEYTEVNGKLSTLTTSECKWFPIKRVLWTVDREIEGGMKKIALRGGDDGPKKLNSDGSFVSVSDVTDDITTIDTWKAEDAPFLRSPEEVGLPAADAYIRDGQLIIDYYHSVVRPHWPKQDTNYNEHPDVAEGEELMTADHASIIISALQELSGNTRRTLHIVSKLLSGGTFAPAEIKRMLETWFFPWAFSRSNMQKKLRDTNKLIREVADEGKSRSWSYKFVNAEEIDSALLDNKPF